MFTEAVVAGLGPSWRPPRSAALAAAEALPGSAWLNLNVSPEFIIAESRCAPSCVEAADASCWR